MSYKNLFNPIMIGNVEIKNRVMMSPMCTNYPNHDGTISERSIEHYRHRAKGEVGLIITEDTTVSPNANYVLNTVGMYDDMFIDGYKKLVEEVHKYGAKIGPQLIHPSFNARESLSGQRPVAASQIASRAYKEIPRELTIEEIERIVEDYGDAARRAQQAGADLVQIHAAHNYHLIGSFMSSLYNKRTDRYGGTLESRLTLLLEVIQNIRSKCGEDFPIIIRISAEETDAGGRTIEETQYILPIIEKAGASAFNISNGSSDSPWDSIPPMGTPLAINANLASAAKDCVDVPIITSGRITTPFVAEGVIRMGKADMVAIARGLLSDHDFALKAKEGRQEDIRVCAGCLQCLVFDGIDMPIKCMQNANLSRESYMDLSPVDSNEKKKVLIIGGGPAGLEAARVAGRRGHDVTLVEKNNKLGGQLLIASVPPMKQELTLVTKHLVSEVEKANVNILLNKEMTTEEIKAFGADQVILATGGKSLIIDSIPGINGANVLDAWDVLSGKVAAGPKTLVIGGGLVGSETADFISHPHNNMTPGANNVTLVEMRESILLDDYTLSRHHLVMSLKKKGVELITNAKVMEVLEDGIKYEQNGKIITLNKFDNIVLAMGTRSNNILEKELEGSGINFTSIGDARKARKILEAVSEGAEVAIGI